ncbi:MAG: DUF2269 domain-containing protein [Euryarchaeota archaeon]|nr:DUF2269 domain-containing protein [Euryarchaeota archaeon]
MTLTPGLRKFALTVHITFAIGWVGAVVAYLPLAAAPLTARDPQTVRAAWIAMELVGWYAIVPLALASLATGLVMGLGTKWGVFRHYWVLFSLLLTGLATAILLLHMRDVSAIAGVAREADGASIGRLGGDLPHAVGALAVLLIILALNVVKPQGMTRYGWRKQHETHISQGSEN